jgi:hypothetical protein
LAIPGASIAIAVVAVVASFVRSDKTVPAKGGLDTRLAWRGALPVRLDLTKAVAAIAVDPPSVVARFTEIKISISTPWKPVATRTARTAARLPAGTTAGDAAASAGILAAVSGLPTVDSRQKEGGWQSQEGAQAPDNRRLC